MSVITAPPRVPGRGVVTVHGALAALALIAVAATAREATWNLPGLLVIAAFTTLSGLAYSGTSSRRIYVQGTPVGLMLAAVVYGAAPAACLGALSICVMQLRLRSARHYLRNNLITFTWFPLIGGVIFHGLAGEFGVGRTAFAFYVIVIPAFVCAITVNFLGVVGYQAWLERSSLLDALRESFLPVMPAELFASLLAMAAVWVTTQTGLLGIGLIGLMFLIFQSLVGELLKSKARATELQRLATTDGLTGLANREAFAAQVTEAIAANPPGAGLALSLIDLDRFKEINDTLGHHYGDQLLREIAQRLEDCAGPDGVVARLGGDEFVILTHDDSGDPEGALRFAEQLLDCVRQPMEVDEIVMSVGASIGIARFPADGQEMNELMRRADVAMYAAKDAQCGSRLYASGLDHHSLRRLSLLGDLTRALEARELIVHYQPIMAADDFTLRGAEALVRWQHPEHGLLPPGAFIESAEQTPMIHPLMLTVLEQAIEQCAEWRRSGRDLVVSVNLSVRNLHNPKLPDVIAGLLSAHRLPPSALKLEITESMIMADPDLIMATIAKLHAIGVCLSVDDFGTGFSSLGYLKNLPIGELKIDRSFVSQMLSDESDLIIVRSTINLGHDLGLKVVAEGVEDAPTLLKLSALGCDLIQGYYISKPMPAPVFQAWMPTPGAVPGGETPLTALPRARGNASAYEITSRR
ncbi:bifunctional diguanylate cyclase/phosphodiesterase [Conexibacter sp. DBS9H8]|uniref:putative bifunctional diguanylate cyclase/phosphodiesterase n=1 Tax=Conexibacter sp. DBS9H8 TaxID=2937801 RepID=UPI00200FDA3A|nr:bifunctional diguanylate cyclase/phosphodiesterase [Conexibacter sp. DBS9H8]